MDVPAKVGAAAGEAIGEAGFRVKSVDVTGVQRMDSRPVFQIALDQKSMAMPLVDVAGIREKLLRYGWVKDARVSRRLPDTLVIDIVERQPAALWQDRARLSLIDSEGVVLDRVKVSDMPDLPLLVGPGANAQSEKLGALLARGADLEAAAGIGRLGRRAALGPQFPVGRDRRPCPKATPMHDKRLQNSPSWTNRRACWGAESSASIFESPAR